MQVLESFEGPAQRVAVTRDAASGWVEIEVRDAGPNPGLNVSALVEVRDGGRLIRLAPNVALAVASEVAAH